MATARSPPPPPPPRAADASPSEARARPHAIGPTIVTASRDMASAMDTEYEPDHESEEHQNLHLQLGQRDGRTVVAVPGEDLQASDTAGWTLATRRAQPHRETPPLRANGESTAKKHEPRSSQAQFARRVTASMTKAARMPANIPRDEHKVIVRPRGGLNTGRVEASALMTAIMAATGTSREETLQDTVCANVAQNIIVLSTPSEQRAMRYAQLRTLNIGDQVFEVNAYHAAPHGTAKGVIYNIAATDTPDDIRANVVNTCNPTAIDAHRIGDSNAVIVLFQGHKVPATVKYGAVLVRCSLYRQHHQVCRQCGKIGHRQDVCPQPQTKVCFACGKPNPGENHAEECKPHCKLCGGQHPSGAPGCTNRFKMPYLVKKRRWERTKPTSPKRAHVPSRNPANFPLLEPQGRRGRSRSCTRPSSAHPDRETSRRRESRSRSKRRASANGRKESRSRERVTWTDVVMNSKQRRDKSSQPKDAMQALREENASLKAEIRRLDQRLEEALRHLSNPQQQRERPTPPASTQPTWEQGRVPRPQSLTPRHQQQPQQAATQPVSQPSNSQAPQPSMKAPKPEAKTPRSPSPEIDMEEQEDEPPQSPNEEQEPRAKNGISFAVRLRRCTERIDRLEKRMDAFEHRVNARFTAVERRLDALQEFLYRKLGRDDDVANTCNPTAQPRPPTWPAHQQQAQA